MQVHAIREDEPARCITQFLNVDRLFPSKTEIDLSQVTERRSKNSKPTRSPHGAHALTSCLSFTANRQPLTALPPSTQLPSRQWPKPIHPPLTPRQCPQSLPKRPLKRQSQRASKPRSSASSRNQRLDPLGRQPPNASKRVLVCPSRRFRRVKLEMIRVL